MAPTFRKPRKVGQPIACLDQAKTKAGPAPGCSYFHAQRGLKLSGYKEIREECTHSSMQNIQACIGTLDPELLIENGPNATSSGDYGARPGVLWLTDDSGDTGVQN